MNGDVAQGWWRAADGYWYPPEARPGQLWQGKVIGPHGEEPPGPGWWLASDYQWYPPDARPGELWVDPIAGTPVGPMAGEVRRNRSDLPGRTVPAARAPRSADARGLLAAGAVLMVISGALMWSVRQYVPDATDGLRLFAWLPMVIGSSVALVGAMRYFGDS